MPQYRSRTTTHGRNMAGARGLWRATGMKDGDFGKPIIAVANSFTQFVPGHVHLKDLGQLVARALRGAGGEHLADLTDQPAQDAGLLLVELGDQHPAGAAPAPHASRCMVAHRPAPWSFATSPSTLSRVPRVTTARPLWCT